MLKKIVVIILAMFLMSVLVNAQIEVDEQPDEDTTDAVVLGIVEEPTFNNNTASVNASEIWATNEGLMDNVVDLYTTLDGRYLLIDTSNDPLGGDLDFGGFSLLDVNTINFGAGSNSISSDVGQLELNDDTIQSGTGSGDVEMVFDVVSAPNLVFKAIGLEDQFEFFDDTTFNENLTVLGHFNGSTGDVQTMRMQGVSANETNFTGEVHVLDSNMTFHVVDSQQETINNLIGIVFRQNGTLYGETEIGSIRAGWEGVDFATNYVQYEGTSVFKDRLFIEGGLEVDDSSYLGFGRDVTLGDPDYIGSHKRATIEYEEGTSAFQGNLTISVNPYLSTGRLTEEMKIELGDSWLLIPGIVDLPIETYADLVIYGSDGNNSNLANDGDSEGSPNQTEILRLHNNNTPFIETVMNISTSQNISASHFFGNSVFVGNESRITSDGNNLDIISNTTSGIGLLFDEVNDFLGTGTSIPLLKLYGDTFSFGGISSRLYIMGNTPTATTYLTFSNDDASQIANILHIASTDTMSFTGASGGYAFDDKVTVTADDGLYVGRYILHDGDTNTYLDFLGDRLRGVAGGLVFWDAIEGALDYMTFNPNGNDISFIFEGDNEELLLVTNGTTDKVGIGTGDINPNSFFEVLGNATFQNLNLTNVPGADMNNGTYLCIKPSGELYQNETGC